MMLNTFYAVLYRKDMKRVPKKWMPFFKKKSVLKRQERILHFWNVFFLKNRASTFLERFLFRFLANIFHWAIIENLGENFVIYFSHLYTACSCVPVVHSILHIAATVRDFGPLTPYTTFNFENLLGRILPMLNIANSLVIGLFTRTCKSTRRHAEEMIWNLQILQSAHQHLNDPTLDISFKYYLLSIIHGKRSNDKNFICTSRKTDKAHPYATICFPQDELHFFNQLQIGNLMLCVTANAVSKSGDDSNIVFLVQDNLLMGRIRSIFTLVRTNTTFLLVDYPAVVNYFTYFINNNNEFKYSSIRSCLKKDMSTCLVQTTDIVEKKKCLLRASKTENATLCAFQTWSTARKLISCFICFLRFY